LKDHREIETESIDTNHRNPQTPNPLTTPHHHHPPRVPNRIGKGRILAAVVMENYLRGRDRAVWVTVSGSLSSQIKRDVQDIGLKLPVRELKDYPPGRYPDMKDVGPGLMVTTYHLLLGRGANGVSRVDQLLSWLGGQEWDGVLALDEAHKVGVGRGWLGRWFWIGHPRQSSGINDRLAPLSFTFTFMRTPHQAKSLRTVTKGGDRIQASKTAAIIYSLQNHLKHARVIYSSATIATRYVRVLLCLLSATQSQAAAKAHPPIHPIPSIHPPTHSTNQPTNQPPPHTKPPTKHHTTPHTSPNNLECLSRLGLWGPGTAFTSSAAFADAMRKAGLPGLELLALNLKQEGKYLSRCLGFRVRLWQHVMRDCVAGKGADPRARV
jgi:hypothetical protein